jgi:hypothetical protein
VTKKPKIPKTHVVDHGFKGIMKELRKLEYKPIVKIGFPEQHNKKDKGKLYEVPGEEGLFLESNFVTVLDVAVFHEFGTIHLPERSFIRASFDKNVGKYNKMTKDLLVKIYSGKATVEKALDILGETILNDIKTFLTNNEVTPPSATEKTLVDTAQMLNSLTYIKVMKP